MPDMTTLEQLEAAVARVEAAAVRLKARYEQSDRRAALLDDAGKEAIAALDALLAGVE
ncbi:MAG: hypothetical protein ACRYG4_20455 [Janthinobacterium lividum]